MKIARLVALLAALCTVAAPAGPASALIEHRHVIVGFNYAPSGTLSTMGMAGNPGLKDVGLGYPVLAGDTIRFTNLDVITDHTVTSLAFDSGFIAPLADYVLDTTGLAQGTYNYFCFIHPYMQASFTVL